MLDGDERPAADDQAAHFTGIPQFWDGGQLLGAQLGKALGRESGWIAWDIYLFYPPGASLDAPSGALAQAGGVVIGTPGLLPALADQSALEPRFRGRAVVVGEQAHLGTLLRQAAASFARRR
jgi:hypothetical protein